MDDCCAATYVIVFGSTKSMWKASVSFPIGHIWLPFDAHVLDADTTILFSIDNMDAFGNSSNILDDTLLQQTSMQKDLIIRAPGHPFITCNSHISR